MTPFYKKLLLWFISFGKIKARIIHFLFLCTGYLIFLVIVDAVLALANNTTFMQEWMGNLSFSVFFLVCAPFVSWRFYDVAQIQLKEYKRLEKKGLTRADLSRIAFVRKWEMKRRLGVKRYCVFEGGLITGVLLLFPVLLFIFLSIQGAAIIFSSMGRIEATVTGCIFASFAIGLLIFRLRWLYNQRRFMRLTNPII